MVQNKYAIPGMIQIIKLINFQVTYKSSCTFQANANNSRFVYIKTHIQFIERVGTF
jgi:hypothetical protein